MEYLSELDTETHRTCGTCLELRPLTDFYRDGKDAEGKPKYRRDCKDCYKATRITEAAHKYKIGQKGAKHE